MNDVTRAQVRQSKRGGKRFYRRILAGDADEAQDHAELLLKDRSLSWYYGNSGISCSGGTTVLPNIA